MQDDNIDCWMLLFKTILDMPVPDSLSSKTVETDEITRRNGTLFWKVKGIAAKITYHLFNKLSITLLDEHFSE